MDQLESIHQLEWTEYDTRHLTLNYKVAKQWEKWINENIRVVNWLARRLENSNRERFEERSVVCRREILIMGDFSHLRPIESDKVSYVRTQKECGSSWGTIFIPLLVNGDVRRVQPYVLPRTRLVVLGRILLRDRDIKKVLSKEIRIQPPSRFDRFLDNKKGKLIWFDLRKSPMISHQLRQC